MPWRAKAYSKRKYYENKNSWHDISKKKTPNFIYFSHTHFHKVQTAPVCSDNEFAKNSATSQGQSQCSVLFLLDSPETQTPDQVHTPDSKWWEDFTVLSNSPFLLQRKSPTRLPLTATPNERVQEGTRKKAAGPFPFYLANETPRN